MIVVLLEYQKAVEIFGKTRKALQYLAQEDGLYRIIIDNGGSVPLYTETDDPLVNPLADFPAAIEVDDIAFSEELNTDAFE